MSQFLTTTEAARHVRLSKATMERLRVKGGGPDFLNPVPGRVLYDVVDLDAWMWSRRRQSTSETKAA
ncbi:hypothetical protein BST63_28425 [Bradyrhizobium canariense]|uniref:Helix-turn-helix domain-containing protein n=1 Tax=Bradyrhizobium canariense TaxID=255045 RepID=A0ABX3WW67_9BRAD|nr:helix-turn-helix domain-containing protein [Bradyrhizobium canariense]OSJ12263.1 hypothetical protein BSR47_24305 [Bradyrhizobium canariense]OSJ23693.1 hypothetical protein BST63_28425 [Bradyrhizobium canariense]